MASSDLAFKTPSEVAAPPQNSTTPKPADDDSAQHPTLHQLMGYVGEWRDLTADARLESLIDTDYYDSHQWTSAEKAALAKRKQPDTVFNRVKPAVNGYLGVVARGKSDPRAWPRTPQAEDSADVATDVLRYCADLNRWSRTKLDCLKDMLVPGTMAVLVGVDADLNPSLTQIRWEEHIYDPYSRREDFKDGRYEGIGKWMYADDVAGLYPEKAEEIRHSAASPSGSAAPDVAMQDRPNWWPSGWVDSKTRRILVVELYYRHVALGWLRCVFTGSVLIECEPSPYLDHKAKPHNPIEAQSAYVDRHNSRYGIVRDMRGPQDEINKRRSKLLHQLSVTQLKLTQPGAITEDMDLARGQAARPDGVIPFGYEVVDQVDKTEGQAQLLAEAKAEIERMGPNPAVLGRDGTDSSGRALMARQQAGLVELAPIYAMADDWELRVFRQIWARVKQFWTAMQYIRVTNDQDSPKFVGVNVPIMGDPVPTIDPTSPGGVVMRARILGYKNAIGEMDVDIEVDTQQDVGTLAQEQLSDLLDLIRSNPALYGPQVPFDVLVQLSTIPHKKSVRDMLKTARAQAEQLGAAQQQAKDQMQAAAVASQIEERKARADQLGAAADKLRANTVLDLHDAHAGPVQDAFATGLDHGQQDTQAAAQAAQQAATQQQPQAPQPG